MTLPTVLGEDRPEPALVNGAQPKPRMSVPAALRAIASLRVTVVLFVLSIILVFAGTLAQIDAGIWTVTDKYFRAAYVWIPFQVFFPRTYQVPGSFPFPGGWTIGACLLVNLLAAHAIRFKLSWKRTGILLIHSGLIVMLLSELSTGLYAVEGKMTLPNGQESNYLEHDRATELAIIRQADSGQDDVVVIPEKIVRKGGIIQHELLPFDLEVTKFFVNSVLGEPSDRATNLATAGDGLLAVAIEKPEATGAEVDVAAAYVTVRPKGRSEAVGTYLVTYWLNHYERPPQYVVVDGQQYEIALRFKRTYKPYTIQLLEFRHDRYLGTDKPKNFSSLVRLTDPTTGAAREALVYMNHPLHYAGETFYQSGVLGNDKGTILQVVRNPGWIMPYVSCALVSGGMLFHFGLHLLGFVRRRQAR